MKKILIVSCMLLLLPTLAFSRSDSARVRLCLKRIKPVTCLKDLSLDHNRLAQYELGNMYRMGRKVRRNYDKALLWLKRSAKLGYTHAQNDLGIMYASGKGVSRSRIRAYAWWLIAYSHGDRGAKTNLRKIKRRMSHSQILKGKRLAKELLRTIRTR